MTKCVEGRNQTTSVPERPIAVDLFAGVGGMSLGFEQAGFDVVCAVEFDPTHAAAHRFNFPRCEVLQTDVSRLKGAELERAVRRGLSRHGRGDRAIDVVIGGPPCQGFSVGGIGDPDDPRNGLVEDYVRLVKLLKPRAFVIENVPAMASRTLPVSRERVPVWISESLGDKYDVSEYRILNARSFGVPQDRRRLLLWGVRKSENAPKMPVATHRSQGKTPERGLSGEEGLPAGPTVKDAIGDLPNLDNFDALLTSDEVVLPRELRIAMGALASPYAKALCGQTRDASDLSWRRQRAPSRLTASLRTTHTDEVRERFASTDPGDSDPVSRFYRLHPEGISPTLRAGSTPDRGSYSAPRPIHPEHPRVISVREAARLHGYPDWFRFTSAKWHGFRQVGNSVCPPFAHAVGDSIRKALEVEVEHPNGTIALGERNLLSVPSGAGRKPGRRLRTPRAELIAPRLQNAA
jgi:DNA (cytosine-5)-methyltransferase 1